METAEQEGMLEALHEDPDQDFASCPREEDDQEDLNPPYELLGEPLASSFDGEANVESDIVGATGHEDRELESERLASLRLPDEDRERSTQRLQHVSSPGSRVADSRSGTGGEDVAGQLQQLISVVGVLASRLERVEAASSDTSSGSQWRPRSDTVNLGYVDHGALDRWYNQAMQEWTGPAGDVGGCPPTSAPGPGREFQNPWFSGPAGWFRQFGNWMGPWSLGGLGRGQPLDPQVPSMFGHAPGPFPVPGQVSGAAPNQGQALGQVPGAAQSPGQVLGQVPGAAQSPGQALGQVPGAAQGPGQALGQVPGAAQSPGQVLGQVQGAAQQHSTGQARGALQGQVTGAAPGQDRVPGTVPSQGQLIGRLQDQARGAPPNQGGGHQGRIPLSVVDQAGQMSGSRGRVQQVPRAWTQSPQEGLSQVLGRPSVDCQNQTLPPGTKVQVLLEGRTREAVVNAQGGLAT